MKVAARAQVIVVATLVGGLGCLAAVAPSYHALGRITGADWALLVAVLLLTIGSWQWPLVLYRNNGSQAFHLDEGFFVILALLLPSTATMGTFAVATVTAQLLKRRPLVKSIFNFGQMMMAVGAGLAVTRLLVPSSHPLKFGQVAAVTAGAGAFFLVNSGLVAVILRATGAAWRECMDGFSLAVALAIAGVLVGVLLSVSISDHSWALGVAIPSLVILRLVVSAQFKAQHDRARMQGLFEVTLEAHRLLRSEAVLDTIVASARELLRCPEAQITPIAPGPGEMAAPIDVAGATHWLVVWGRSRTEPFDNADRILLDAVAAIGKGALSNAELYRQVRFERERLASITLSIGEGVCAVDANGRLTFVNPAAAEIIHLPSVSVTVSDPIDKDALQAPDFLVSLAREAMDTRRVVTEDDVHFPGRDGGLVPVAYTASPVLDNDEPVGAVITFRDITERKAHEDEMVHHAFYDSLTGLANRRYLVDHLDQALKRSALDHKTHALIFVDVDRFKSINDSLGHVTGDDLLVAIANRMKGAVRGHDLLARFGGDEFILLLEDVADVDEAVAAARRICAAVEEPMTLSDGYEIVASLSVGIALTEPGKTSDDILRDADVAMYEAKIKGRGGAYQVFDIAAMGSRSSERLELEAALRRGLERQELEVHYQPFFSVKDLEIVGAEALVRWRHPEHGLLEPGRFIGMAEEAGLILPIGRYVMELACQEARAVRDNLGIELPISVNLSPRQFQLTSLVSDVARILEDSKLDPGAITFEITETMVMDDLAGAREVMKKLNRLGVRLAIDDFGTGHSSLGYLKQFPVHEVKVDRMFVKGVAEHPVDSAIVRAVVELASAMDIVAVAEGVETAEQLAGLKMLGCPVGQGYWFSRPLPVADFDNLLRRHFRPQVSDVGILRPGRLVS